MSLKKLWHRRRKKKVLLTNTETKMKNIFFSILLFLGCFNIGSAQNEKLDKLFQQFENKNGITSISIKKPMFKILSNLELDDDYLKKIKPILKDVDGLKLVIVPKATFPKELESENIENIKLNIEKTNEINESLEELHFDKLMSINNDGVSMKFLAEAEKGDVLQNLVFNIDSDDENILFLLNGKMKMDDVNKIINSTEMQISVSNPSAKNNSKNNSSYLNGESRNVGEFSGVQVSAGIVVNYKQELNSLVKVIADADKLQYIVTKVEDGILKVSIDTKGQRNLKFKNVNVNVSSPKINEIKTSSGSIFNSVNNIHENQITVDVSSGSVVNANFNIQEKAFIDISSGAIINSQINTKDIFIKSASGAAANFTGNANSGIIDISSGAVCNAKDMKFNKLKAEVSSGGIITSHVTQELSAKASSGGIIRFKGNPQIHSNISKNSGGMLKQID